MSDINRDRRHKAVFPSWQVCQVMRDFDVMVSTVLEGRIRKLWNEYRKNKGPFFENDKVSNRCLQSKMN